MKTVTVAQAEANFSALLRVVAAGEEVKVVHRKKAVARIVPMIGAAKKSGWARHFAKLDEIFGGRAAPGKPGSRIIIEGRRRGFISIPASMKAIIHLTREEEAKALPILLRHSAGLVLPQRIYVLSEGALTALRKAGIQFSKVSPEAVAPGLEEVAGERV